MKRACTPFYTQEHDYRETTFDARKGINSIHLQEKNNIIV